MSRKLGAEVCKKSELLYKDFTVKLVKLMSQ